MIAYDSLLNSLITEVENETVVWQLQAMTGSAKQVSWNGIFHGISGRPNEILYKNQFPGMLVNY
jgi:hypothetical protein